jgi:hypothetical protein
LTETYLADVPKTPLNIPISICVFANVYRSLPISVARFLDTGRDPRVGNEEHKLVELLSDGIARGLYRVSTAGNR